MIKVIYCIRRKADLSAQEFQRYWKEVHAPLMLEQRAALRLAAYVQTSPLDHAYSARVQRSGVLDTPFDGVAELYWATDIDMRYAFESEEALRVQKLLAADERHFIDHARSARWVAAEAAPIPRQTT